MVKYHFLYSLSVEVVEHLIYEEDASRQTFLQLKEWSKPSNITRINNSQSSNVYPSFSLAIIFAINCRATVDMYATFTNKYKRCPRSSDKSNFNALIPREIS